MSPPHHLRAARRSWRRSAATLALGALIGASSGCDSGATPTAAVAGAGALSRFYAIGTGLTMGWQSSGVLHDSQVQSWASLFAHGVGATFAAPEFRTPGCPAPLIAPLIVGRRLNSSLLTAVDSSCAGALGTVTLPLNNLAIAGATAWDALRATPKSVTANSALPALVRAEYPLVLGSTQSQVTAMMVNAPSFVSLELGLGEILPAVQRGRLIAATRYGQTSAWTYVPAALFDTVARAIADSITLTGARAVVLSVPKPSKFVGLRRGDELWTDRATLLANGIVVGADCQGSTNLVYTPAVIPVQAALAAQSGSARTISCADTPGTDDYILTAAEVTTLDGVASAMNTVLQGIATAKGWAFADLSGLYDTAATERGSYKAANELSCASPYGRYMSLDGVHPNVTGHQVIAWTVGAAVNAKYGFAFPVAAPTGVALPVLCP